MKSGFLGGFKKFITRGNIIDMAVGVIIGASFNAIVTALVNGIILQGIAVLTGNADFSKLAWLVNTGRVDEANNPIIVAINYGLFIQAIVNFFIIAFTLYVIVQVVIKKSLKREKEALRLEEEKKAAEALKEPEIPEDIVLLRAILEEIKNKK